jgi:hypothetical protein
MKNKKIGYIYQILETENIGLIREGKSGNEYIFFLDELSKYETKSVAVGASVSFEKDETFTNEIATNLITIHALKKAA